MRRRVPLLLFASVMTVSLSFSLSGSRSRSDGLREFRGRSMGTSYSVKIVDLPGSLSQEELAEALEGVITGVDQKMSTYDRHSELMQFNRTKSTGWIQVSPQLAEVLSLAIEVSLETDGAFDVTVGRLVDLWGFGPQPKDRSIPEQARVEKALKVTGSKLLEIRRFPPTVRKLHPNVSLDLSGIAKGYAVDRVMQLLMGLGIDHCLVEIGGELKARGRNPAGRLWRVGIEEPVSESARLRRVVALEETALATSGDYRNFYKRDSRTFQHTIDPRTGRPSDNGLTSVTVADSSTARADALATAFMVMGAQEAYDWALRQRVPAFFIHRVEGELVEQHTPLFQAMLQTGE